MTEQTEKILKRLKDNHDGLRMSRVPANTKKAFIKLADEEFESDYGMLLKWLMDGIISADVAEVLGQINELRVRVERLEAQPKEQPTSSIKLLGGKKIKVNRDE